MKDEDFFRDCIDQFNESQKKGKKLDVFPLNWMSLMDIAEKTQNFGWKRKILFPFFSLCCSLSFTSIASN